MKIKLIRFLDDTYAVRKGNWWIGYKYLDLHNPKYWWRKKSEYFWKSSITDSYDTAFEYYSKFRETENE